MAQTFIEQSYPISFRAADAKSLGEHLRLRHSVELVGMKRVGISNFLRFFLYHPDITKTYIQDDNLHLFVPVDLNDLVEIKLFSFWVLTFKRLVDSLDTIPNHEPIKRRISNLFLTSIQSGDLFLTTENLRQALSELVASGVTPTIFFLRFDRLQEAINDQFVANLQGLIEATDHRLAYVFTSFRTLDQIFPTIFSRQAVFAFSHQQYIKPATGSDMEMIFDSFEKKYQIEPSHQMLETLIELSGGHVQYLLLCLIIIHEKLKDLKKFNPESVRKILLADERMALQSEEIWESLTSFEQTALQAILHKESLSSIQKQQASYIWDTGITTETRVFSPIFSHYLSQNHQQETTGNTDFTHKEHLLFTFLKEHLSDICDRETIIENVWPESAELGVSDWTIDRLVARIRQKLKKQRSEFSIVTIRTRGYKLIHS
jgi:hypothetical protein